MSCYERLSVSSACSIGACSDDTYSDWVGKSKKRRGCPHECLHLLSDPLEPSRNIRFRFSILPRQVPIHSPESMPNRKNYRNTNGHNEMVPIPNCNWKPMCCHSLSSSSSHLWRRDENLFPLAVSIPYQIRRFESICHRETIRDRIPES
ncbi:MAG: hypothetical protein BWZ06_01459 [Bacteroidetes bacterium ADurb.BinA261]|jgi:hypothetical protein|nr:MAG: hypothetical protein BWZ06_01459 [Bacteroidetes bacterium ADurb.BinA261]